MSQDFNTWSNDSPLLDVGGSGSFSYWFQDAPILEPEPVGAGALSLIKSVSDALTLSDAYSYFHVKFIVKAVADSRTFSDTVATVHFRFLTKAVTDTLTLSESASRLLVIRRSFSDEIILDDYSTIGQFFKASATSNFEFADAFGWAYPRKHRMSEFDFWRLGIPLISPGEKEFAYWSKGVPFIDSEEDRRIITGVGGRRRACIM